MMFITQDIVLNLKTELLVWSMYRSKIEEIQMKSSMDSNSQQLIHNFQSLILMYLFETLVSLDLVEVLTHLY